MVDGHYVTLGSKVPILMPANAHRLFPESRKHVGYGQDR